VPPADAVVNAVLTRHTSQMGVPPPRFDAATSESNTFVPAVVAAEAVMV